MRPTALFGLGLKLALGSDRGAKLRFALMSLSIGVGVAVIIAAFSAIPAIQARDARNYGLEYVSTEGRTDAPDQLILTERDSWFEGQRLKRFLVAPIGDAPLPPGVKRLPRPRESVASPALEQLLDGPERALLDDRIRGRIVGVIGEDGLPHPDQLIAYVGVRPDEIEEIERSYVTGFGIASPSGVPPEVLQTVVFGSMGVLLPVLVFVWTATRLSARLREERLAAIRLAGATPRQVRLLSAVESGLAAVAGTAIGFGLFLGLRELLAIPVELGLEPTDAFPPIPALVGVIAGAPLLSVIVAWMALRRVTRSPLSVVRRAPRRSRIALPAAVAFAIGLLLWISLDSAYRRWGDTGPWVVFILGAWVLTTLGVIGLGPWIGTRAIGWVTQRSPSVGTWLGSRRLEWDGRAASRVSAAVVAVVFAAGVTAGYLVFFEASPGGLRASADLSPETIVLDTWVGDGRQVLDEVTSTPGVTSAALIRTTYIQQAGSEGFAAGVTIVACDQLANVVRAVPPGCASGAILSRDPEETNFVTREPGVPLDIFLPYPEERAIPFPIRIPQKLRSTSFSADGQYSGFLIDEAAIPEVTLRAIPATRILVSTDGRPETVERIREAVAWSAPHPTVHTRAELAADEQGGSIPVRYVIELGTYFAVFVAAASLLVSTVGAVQERRKPLAALAALGVPSRSLRRSVLVQTMAPLIAGVLLAGLAATVVVLATPVDNDFPWLVLVAPIGRFVVIAVIAGLVASALAFPSLRRGIRPEALHNE